MSSDVSQRAAVLDVLRQNRSRLRQLLTRYRIPPPGHIDPLLKQTMCSVPRNGEKISAPEAWLLCALKNQCVIYWAKRRRRRYSAGDSPLLHWLGEEPALVFEKAVLLYLLLALFGNEV